MIIVNYFDKLQNFNKENNNDFIVFTTNIIKFICLICTICKYKNPDINLNIKEVIESTLEYLWKKNNTNNVEIFHKLHLILISTINDEIITSLFEKLSRFFQKRNIDNEMDFLLSYRTGNINMTLHKTHIENICMSKSTQESIKDTIGEQQLQTNLLKTQEDITPNVSIVQNTFAEDIKPQNDLEPIDIESDKKTEISEDIKTTVINNEQKKKMKKIIMMM